MKNKKLSFLFLTALFLAGCNNPNPSTSSSFVSNSDISTDTTNSDSSITDSETSQEEKLYTDKEVNIYRSKNIEVKPISLRFFNDMPNVPYIEVTAFYKEFFNTELVTEKTGSSYTYKYDASEPQYFGFDVQEDTFYAYDLYHFSSHPDFKESTGHSFVTVLKAEKSNIELRTVDLKKYEIPLYEEDGEAYTPLTFLSQLSGGFNLFNIAYNGKDIYVLDYSASLFDEATNPDYYKESYYEVLSNTAEERSDDLAKYTYNELCLVFDNFRGETSQLLFGDDKLLTLGLDGILTKEYPELKNFLLSNDKNEYYAGIEALFAGLFDGGHTVMVMNFAEYTKATGSYKDQSFKSLVSQMEEAVGKKTTTSMSVTLSKVLANIKGKDYYQYNELAKTAYIGFDSFNYDVVGWDSYYEGTGKIPVETDSYAFVREKFYQAKKDGAENVVIDITGNGGGSSYAYAGVVALCNKAASSISIKDTFNRCKQDEYYGIDINLDGKYDEEDVKEAEKFDFNIGVLTSSYSFSCANLFPSAMKELGFKIIGERSGGGSCAINIKTTADGLMYVHSSYQCLTDNEGHNIDSGIEPDYVIEPKTREDLPTLYDYSSFFDFVKIGQYLSTAYTD